MRPDWEHGVRPIRTAETTAFRVREVLLRTPAGGAPGGECVVERLDAAGQVLDRRLLAFQPAEAQAILDAGLVAGLRAVFEARGEVPPGAREAPPRAAAAEGEIPILRLG